MNPRNSGTYPNYNNSLPNQPYPLQNMNPIGISTNRGTSSIPPAVNQGTSLPQGPQTGNALGRFGGSNLNLSGGSNLNLSGGGPHPVMGIPTMPNVQGMGNMAIPNSMNSRPIPPNFPQQQYPLNQMRPAPNTIPSNYNSSADSLGVIQKPVQGNLSNSGSYNQAAMVSNMMDRSLPKTESNMPLHSSGEFPFVPTGMNRVVSKVNMKPNEQEFTLGNDDFPALPGFKGSTELSQNEDSSPPQTSYSSFQSNVNPQYLSKVQNYETTFPPTESSLNRATPSTSQSVSYEQFLPPIHVKPNPTKIPPNIADTRFGLLGLLSVLRMPDADLNMLALGIDLTTLGLPLSSTEPLYSTFASPWADGPSRQEPEFWIPMCYYMQTPLPLPISKMSLFSDETLFYIFYSMPRDILQAAASAELFKRDWRYHKEHKIWLFRIEATKIGPNAERGSYYFYDLSTWKKVQKDFTIVLDQLETTPSTLISNQK